MEELTVQKKFVLRLYFGSHLAAMGMQNLKPNQCAWLRLDRIYRVEAVPDSTAFSFPPTSVRSPRPTILENAAPDWAILRMRLGSLILYPFITADTLARCYAIFECDIESNRLSSTYNALNGSANCYVLWSYQIYIRPISNLISSSFWAKNGNVVYYQFHYTIIRQCGIVVGKAANRI